MARAKRFPAQSNLPGTASAAAVEDDDDGAAAVAVAAAIFLRRVVVGCDNVNGDNNECTGAGHDGAQTDGDASSAVIFSPHPCRKAPVAPAPAATGRNLGAGEHSHNDDDEGGGGGGDKKTKNKKKGLFKFLGGGGGGSNHNNIAADGIMFPMTSNGAPFSMTTPLPIPFTPPPALTAPHDDRRKVPPPPPPQQHQQKQQERTLFLLNLDEVSILSNSGVSGSFKTPFDESRTATHTTTTAGAGSSSEEDQLLLSRDAQQVLGGLRKQRESREEKKRMQAHGGGGPLMSSQSSHNKRSLASKLSGSRTSAKKNGIDPDAMVGTVLVLPCNSGSNNNNKNSHNNSSLDHGGDGGPRCATGPASTSMLTMVDLFVPASPARLMSPADRRKESSAHHEALPAPEDLFPRSSNHSTNKEASLKPSFLPDKPAKKPFVAPPPLMEDWSDDDDDDDAKEGATDRDIPESAACQGAAVDCEPCHYAPDDSVISPGPKTPRTPEPAESGVAAAVLRDYCGMRNGAKDGRQQQHWTGLAAVGDGSSSLSPKDVRQIFVEAAGASRPPSAGTSEASGQYKSRCGSDTVRDRLLMEESKEAEDEQHLPPSNHFPVVGVESPSQRAPSPSPPPPPPPPSMLRAITSWGPFTFPSTRSLETQFRQHDIAVAPGVRLPVRGVRETMAALRQCDTQPSSFSTTRCWTCEAFLCCLRDAEFVLCPTCRVVSPLDVAPSSDGCCSVFDGTGSERMDEDSLSRREPRNGVALGFTDSEWLQWRQQISLYEEG